MHLREAPLVAALQRLGGGRHRFNNLARPAQPSGHTRVSRPPWRLVAALECLNSGLHSHTAA